MDRKKTQTQNSSTKTRKQNDERFESIVSIFFFIQMMMMDYMENQLDSC